MTNKNNSRKRRLRSEQESFWAGEFGDAYTARNRGDHLLATNLATYARILGRTPGVKSVFEFGANRGLNLQAIRQLLPQASLEAVEINPTAVAELKKIPGLTVHHQSILDFQPRRKFDFVLIAGVLIHINPRQLAQVYQRLNAAAARFICLTEYYNPTPLTVPYRGHTERLYKRDFAGEMLKSFPDLRLLDYGFVYHGDPVFPGDDFTWFLLEKRSTRTK